MPVSTPPALSPAVVTAAAQYADTWIALRRNRLRIPGIQVAVRLGGELLLSSAHGVADVGTGEPLRTDHVFRVASHSKTFTAVAVLRLAERGHCRLDDPLATHLDWIAEMNPELARATLRELLGHAAGVTRDGTGRDFWQLREEFPDAATLREIARTGGDLIPRGERFKYSNIGYGLLGAVVESVTGRSWAEHLRADLLGPLGLASTAPDLPVEATNLVTGHSSLSYADERFPLPNPGTGALAAATGFCSTAEDLTAWFSAMRAGCEDVLTAHTRRLAHREEWATDPSGTDSGGYGLGFITETCGGRRLVGHSGGFPGQITKSVLDPKAGLAVTVLTNCIDRIAAEVTLGVVKLVDAFAAAGGEEHPHDPETDLDGFCGRWANLWGVFDVIRAGSTLLVLHPDSPDPAASTTRLVGAGPDAVRVVADNGFGDYGETWTRGRRPDGTPFLTASSGQTVVPLTSFDLP